MTLAPDLAKSTTPQRRKTALRGAAPSAEALLAEAMGSPAANAPTTETPAPPKPGFDWADAVIMSTADTKAPPAPNGANDLLADIVADHLSRATPGTQSAPDVGPPAEEDPTKALQAQVESLLAGTPHPSAPIEPSPTPKAEAPTDAVTPEETASLNALEQTERQLDLTGGSISAEELDALLSKAELPRTEESPSEAPVADPLADVAAEKIMEADGVLAAELAQLVQTPMEPAGKTVHEEVLVAPQAEVAAATVQATTTEAVTYTAPTIENPAPTSPVAAAPVAAAAVITAETAPKPIIEKEVEPAEPVVKKPSRLARLPHDLALMTAQAIDLPFRWVSELDKHIIGVAAFLLLLGGALLYAVSLFLK